MDSRDFRKKWLQLQESWNEEEAYVNLNASKAEKLQEKRKLPDALKAHQFGKKDADGDAGDKKDDKNLEKDKKEYTKNKKEYIKKPSLLKKNTVEGKKSAKIVKKMKENGEAGGAITSADVGGSKGVCPDAHVGAPERLQKRKMPEKVVTAKESKLFSHFKKYMAESGLSKNKSTVNNVTDDMDGEATGEEKTGDTDIKSSANDIVRVIADIQDRFPGKKIRICVEADPTEPFSDEDVAAAEAAIATVPEEGELEGEENVDESLSVREDEDVEEVDDAEEIPTGNQLGDDSEEEEALDNDNDIGVEVGSEASPEMISMTPEQWMEFLKNDENEEELGNELAKVTKDTDVTDAGEGDDSDSESKKNSNKLG